MIEQIIEYLEKEYTISVSDLGLPNDERDFLMGQLSMIAEIKDIAEHGIPNKDEDDK